MFGFNPKLGSEVMDQVTKAMLETPAVQQMMNDWFEGLRVDLPDVGDIDWFGVSR